MKKDLTIQSSNFNILKVEITEGPNYKERNVEITVDGKSEDVFPKKEKYCDYSEAQEFHFGINDKGVIAFGFWNHDPATRPGHGGMWSGGFHDAREITGLDIMEVIIIIEDKYRIGSYMLVENVRPLINSIGWDLSYGNHYYTFTKHWYPVVNDTLLRTYLESEGQSGKSLKELTKKYLPDDSFESIMDMSRDLSSNHNSSNPKDDSLSLLAANFEEIEARTVLYNHPSRSAISSDIFEADGDSDKDSQ